MSYLGDEEIGEREYVYTFDETHPMYWKQCDQYIGEKLVKRVMCDDFVQHDGFWFPESVNIYKISQGKMVLGHELTLLKANVNPEDLSTDTFASPSAENMEVRYYNR